MAYGQYHQSYHYNGAMNAYSLSRADAQKRYATLNVSRMYVTLDLSDAADPKATHFPVTSVATLTAAHSSTFIDCAGLIDSVLIDDAPASYTQSGSQVFIDALPVGQECTLTVNARCAYSTTGEGLHRYHDPEDGSVYLYTQFEPTDAHRAWPCFDQPDIKPRWTFQVTAPAQWVITSNGTIATTHEEGGTRTVTFSETLPLSSYITAIVVGDYAVVDGGEWTPNEQTQTLCPQAADLRIPLRVMCRRTLAPYMDSDDILTVTRQGFDFFHQKYRVLYPWGAYDQIFVPEYNLGAMENPGCVTFNERHLSRDTPTYAERQSRANTILHEMCHMWFGDLATPAWWDDLWLKESFADNQGTMAAAEATQYTTEWASFAVARKAWANQQDLYPTTHPIVADIPDVEAAKTNFDGITYAKGAAVLKQLVAWVGQEAFFNAAHRYFTTHAFGATGLHDLLDALTAETGMDLGQWERAWLHTTAPNLITTQLIEEDGKACVQIRQQPVGDLDTVPRPQVFTLALYTMRDGVVEHLVDHELRITDAEHTYPLTGADGQPLTLGQIDMVVPNSTDDAYAITVLDEPSLETAASSLTDISEAVTRAVVWSSLWNAVRVVHSLAPARYRQIVCEHLTRETDLSILQRLLDTLRIAIGTYMHGANKQAASAQTSDTLVAALGAEEDGDRRRFYARIAMSLCASLDDLREADEALLNSVAHGEHVAIPASDEFRWRALTVLAAHGRVDVARLEDELRACRTGETEVYFTRASAALPDAQVRQAVWERVLHGSLSNEHLSASLEGLAISTWDGQELTWSFFDEALPFWQGNSIGMGIRFIRGAFPATPNVDSHERSTAIEERAQRWLDEHGDAPEALRRLMVEGLDDLRRAMRIQRAWDQA